jgi:hypothetical protein
MAPQLSGDMVLLELNARWNCSLPFGWIPIYDTATDEETVDIYSHDYFLPFAEQVKQCLRDTFNASTLYEIEEGGTVRLLDLDECVFDYDGHEYMYTDLSFSFLIYFSHEQSVTIGGEKLRDEIYRIWPEGFMHPWVW